MPRSKVLNKNVCTISTTPELGALQCRTFCAKRFSLNLFRGRLDSKCRIPNSNFSKDILKVDKNILNYKAIDNGKSCGAEIANENFASIEKMKIHHFIRWEYDVYKSTWVGFKLYFRF